MRCILLSVAGGFLLAGLCTPEALAQKKKVEIHKKWSGTVADRDLLKTAPEIIASKTALEKVWKAWKIEGDLPAIDFKKTIVVVVTSLQGGLGLYDATLDEKGNLELTARVTLEATGNVVPGFRFVLGTVNREGIVSVKGKKVGGAQEKMGPRMVGEITKVEFAQQDIRPPNLIVTVAGKVNAAGYTKPRLVRAVYAMPPEDGIQDYFLLAVPPDGVAAQVVSEVTAFDNWKGFTKEAPWLKGIRIHGAKGAIVTMFAK